MKERPILFKDEMVRAILEGRKTQTRRILKPQPDTVYGMITTHSPQFESKNCVCPYGEVGDKLWVRETWQAYKQTSVEYDEWEVAENIADVYGHEYNYVYRADNESFPEKWFPSIYMPWFASRIKLEITDIRFERLQDISEEDAWKEGCPEDFIPNKYPSSIAWFYDIWGKINGSGSWDENHLVVVISFRKVEG